MNTISPHISVFLLFGILISHGVADAQLIYSPDRCVYASDVRVSMVPLDLKGITRVRVLVPDRFAFGQNTPLADSLRTEIEAILKHAGVGVLSARELRNVPGEPTLYFRT